MKTNKLSLIDYGLIHQFNVYNWIYDNDSMTYTVQGNLEGQQKSIMIPFVGQHFIEAQIPFLDETLNIGAAYNFIPKKMEDLSKEGWYKRQDGKIVKSGGKILYTPKKAIYMGQLLVGTLKITDNFTPLFIVNKHRYDESMIKYVFQSLVQEIGEQYHDKLYVDNNNKVMIKQNTEITPSLLSDITRLMFRG